MDDIILHVINKRGKKMGRISIVRTDKELEKSVLESINLIGGIERFIGHNDKVMLKPNVNGTEATTNPLITEALIRIVTGYGIKELIIAESTFGNANMTDMFFEKNGYRSLAEKYGIRLLNLNRSAIENVKVRKPMVLDNIRMAKEALDGYKIINIPVMKVHYATGVTLSMKNLKGLLALDEKRHFHEVGLDKAIVDLNNSIKPALNIVDCTHCMERMGPRGGDIIDLDLVMAGRDCAETDYIGCRIMGYTIEEVKHLEYYIQTNNVDLSRIEIAGEKIEDVQHSFRKVEMDRIVPKGFRIENKNSCSACMNAMLLSCQFLGEGKNNIAADIYLGSDIKTRESAGRSQVGFGNCACRNRNFEIEVKGCPPFPFALKEKLESR